MITRYKVRRNKGLGLILATVAGALIAPQILLLRYKNLPGAINAKFASEFPFPDIWVAHYCENKFEQPEGFTWQTVTGEDGITVVNYGFYRLERGYEPPVCE